MFSKYLNQVGHRPPLFGVSQIGEVARDSGSEGANADIEAPPQRLHESSPLVGEPFCSHAIITGKPTTMNANPFVGDGVPDILSADRR